MKKIAALMESFDQESQEIAEKTINRCLKAVDCERVDWPEFLVYKKSEEIVRKMLYKLEAGYILAIATAVEASEVKVDQVKISVVNSDEASDRLQTIIDRSTMTALIFLSKESKKFLG